MKLDPLLLVAVALVAWWYLRDDSAAPVPYAGPGARDAWGSTR